MAYPEKARQQVIIALAEELQGTFEECMPELTGVYADLLGWALKYVNWVKVTEQLFDEE